jgi:hypothetical protein
MSLLDRLLNRMLAQRACLDFAFRDLAEKLGVVFELGLGKGRTFSHLREHLPDREIYVFDRAVEAHKTAMPDPAHLFLGPMSETLPKAVARFRGQVVLAHTDVGGYEGSHNEAMKVLVAEALPPAIMKGGLIVSDLKLTIPGAQELSRPAGAPDGWYFIYRM